MFYVIAVLFAGVGAMLLMATRQRLPKTANTTATTAPPKSQQPKPQRPQRPRRPRRSGALDDTPEVERISREEYLRQLAERNGIQRSGRQHS